MAKWETGKPPNEEVVEVKRGRQIIRVRAMWGRDGSLPHWEAEDRSVLWSPNTFTRWRRVPHTPSGSTR